MDSTGGGAVMEVLHFIFSGFWVFVGVLVLTGCVLSGIAEIVAAFRGKQ
jgi:uncharacterized membrane protein YccF (DUF307 family)